jgi:nitronate monooxygenase
MTLARKSAGKVDGFVVDGSSAGGHSAPPRGPLTLDANDEPVYGPRDSPDLEQIRALGLPFWLGGSYGDSLKSRRPKRAVRMASRSARPSRSVRYRGWRPN